MKSPAGRFELSLSFFPIFRSAGSELINRVVSHPSEPVSITAHENRTIRFLDNKTGMFSGGWDTATGTKSSSLAVEETLTGFFFVVGLV